MHHCSGVRTEIVSLVFHGNGVRTEIVSLVCFIATVLG